MNRRKGGRSRKLQGREAIERQGVDGHLMAS